MTNMLPRRPFIKIHKWVGLIVGIQVLLWTASGFIMSFFPIEKVRGENEMNREPEPPFTLAEVGIDIRDLFASNDHAALQRVTLRRALGRLVYELEDASGRIQMIDAESGQLMSPLSDSLAAAFARRDFTGEGEPIAVQWVEATTSEYRKKVPVWRVDFNNDLQTAIYVSPENGEILARRNTIWRLYDFFWMLHIMDYKNRTDFNHPLLVGAAVLAFTVSLTGVLLLFTSFRKRDFIPKRKRTKTRRKS
jgi:uncharacterized iron-regulated membrane protein